MVLFDSGLERGLRRETREAEKRDKIDKPESAPTPEAREMREMERARVELTGDAISYVERLMSDRKGVVEREIARLERSLFELKESNPNNAKEELKGLRNELDRLRLVEKLFNL